MLLNHLKMPVSLPPGVLQTEETPPLQPGLTLILDIILQKALPCIGLINLLLQLMMWI